MASELAPFLDMSALLEEDAQHMRVWDKELRTVQDCFIDFIKSTANKIAANKTPGQELGWMPDWNLHPALQQNVESAPAETLAHIPCFCVKNAIDVAIDMQKNIHNKIKDLHHYTILKTTGGEQSILYNNIILVRFIVLRAIPSHDKDFQTLHAILRILTELHKQTNDAECILFYIQCLARLSALQGPAVQEASTVAGLPPFYQSLLEKYNVEPCGWLLLRSRLGLPHTPYVYGAVTKGAISDVTQHINKKEKYKMMDVSVSGGGIGPAVRILDPTATKTIIYIWVPHKHSGVFYTKKGPSCWSALLFHAALVFRKFAIIPKFTNQTISNLSLDISNIMAAIPGALEETITEFCGPMRPLGQWAIPPLLFKLYMPPVGGSNGRSAINPMHTEPPEEVEITFKDQENLQLPPNSDYAHLWNLTKADEEAPTAPPEAVYMELHLVYVMETLKHECQYDPEKEIEY